MKVWKHRLIALLAIYAAVLCSPIVRSAPAEPATPTPTVETNVALQCTYVESGKPSAGWTGLTDGVKDSDVAPACYATGGETPPPKWVTLDLGRVYPVKQINVYNSLNGNTKSVALYVGEEAGKLTYLWEHRFPDRQLRTFQQQFPPRPIRYVKILFKDSYGGGFGGDAVMYLREVEVLADVAPETLTGPGRETSAVLNFPRDLRLFRRLTLTRRFPTTVLVLDGVTETPLSWSAPMETALRESFGYKPEDMLTPRVLCRPLPESTVESSAADLVRLVKRVDADLTVLLVNAHSFHTSTGVELVGALTRVCGTLINDTVSVPLLVLLPAPGASNGGTNPGAQATEQLRAAARQAGYLAGVGVLDWGACPADAAAATDVASPIPHCRLVSEFVARTLRDYQPVSR